MSLGLIFSLWGAWVWLDHVRSVIVYPFGLDYGEGVILNQLRLLQAGQNPYPPLEGRYLIGNYPPVFYLLSLLFSGSNLLSAGRMIAAACAVLIVGVMILLSLHLQKLYAHEHRSWLAALSGPLIFIGIGYLYSWGGLMRVDTLALLFSLLGLLCFVNRSSWGQYAAIVCFILAFYTKQTAMVSAAACLLVTLIQRPRKGLQLSGLLALGLGLCFLLIQQLSQGQAWFHLVTANANTFLWYRVAFLFNDLLKEYFLLLLLAGVGVANLLFERRTFPCDEHDSDLRLILPIYLILALGASLSIGKIGSNVNYALEFMILVCLCAGAALYWALRLAASTEIKVWLGLILPVLMVGQLIKGNNFELRRSAEVPDSVTKNQVAELIRMVREIKGLILADDLSILGLAEKPVVVDPFIMSQLAREQKWDQQPLLDLISQRAFKRVVLQFDLDNPHNPAMATERFTPEMLVKLKQFYRLESLSGNYWIYQPVE